MRVLVQRVTRASVTVDGKIVGAIERGLLAFVGFRKGDSAELLTPLAEKLTNLRVFPDERDRLHFSVLDIRGGLLLVPQFTLYGDTKKGRRPDFFDALEPELAESLFNQFVDQVRVFKPERLETGIFRAHMQVELLNDGPVTLMLES